MWCFRNLILYDIPTRSPSWPCGRIAAHCWERGGWQQHSKVFLRLLQFFHVSSIFDFTTTLGAMFSMIRPMLCSPSFCFFFPLEAVDRMLLTVTLHHQRFGWQGQKNLKLQHCSRNNCASHIYLTFNRAYSGSWPFYFISVQQVVGLRMREPLPAGVS